MSFDLDQYYAHHEELIAWLHARADDDDLLARALPRSATFGRLTGAQMRELVGEFRDYASKAAMATGRWERLVWLIVVRYYGWLLRMEARQHHRHRVGFDPAWLRPPR